MTKEEEGDIIRAATTWATGSFNDHQFCSEQHLEDFYSGQQSNTEEPATPEGRGVPSSDHGEVEPPREHTSGSLWMYGPDCVPYRKGGGHGYPDDQWIESICQMLQDRGVGRIDRLACLRELLSGSWMEKSKTQGEGWFVFKDLDREEKSTQVGVQNRLSSPEPDDEESSDLRQMGTDPGSRCDSESVLLEAHRLIEGERHSDHGDVHRSFALIAEAWTQWLEGQYPHTDLGDLYRIQPDDVAMMMVLMKITRLQCGRPKRDHVVDIAGYAALFEKLSNLET